MIDERWPCPWCGNPRIADYMDWGRVCFNCHRQWPPRVPKLARRHIPGDVVRGLAMGEPMARPSRMLAA
jgi:hypothetical protein